MKSRPTLRTRLESVISLSSVSLWLLYTFWPLTYFSTGVSPLTCCWKVLSALDDLKKKKKTFQKGSVPCSKLPNPFTIILPLLSPNRGAVCNVLLTCCKDSVCRLWAETLLPGDSLLSGHHNNHNGGQHSDTLRCASTSKKNNCNGKTQGRTTQEVRYVNVVFVKDKYMQVTVYFGEIKADWSKSLSLNWININACWMFNIQCVFILF